MEGLGKCSLYKIENSEYIKWLKQQSYGMYDGVGYKHYCRLTLDEVIEVISEFEPEVRFVKS